MNPYHVNRPPPNPVTVPPTIGAKPPEVPKEPAPTREELRELRQRLAVLMAQPSTDETARQRDLTSLARMFDRVLVLLLDGSFTLRK